MDEENEEKKIVPICSWEFDSYSSQHWEEKKNKNVDLTKSWVELNDTYFGQQIVLFVDKEKQLVIDADRDQWGTWITFKIGEENFTVAQEDGTMSFVDSLIAALTKFKQITDIQTEPPKFTDQ